MSDTSADDQQIYSSACDCDGLFQRLKDELKLRQTSHYAIIRDYHLRFGHWVDFVGALADEQASLDNRLRPYPEVRELVLQMLRMLSTNLGHVKQYETESLEDIDVSRKHQAEEFKDDNKSKAMPDAQTGRRIESPSGLAAHDVDRSKQSATLAAQASLSAVEEAVNRLHRLATIIRRSSTSNVASKVKRFALKSNAAENAEFERFTLLRLHGTLPGIKDSLARQLVASISQRRLRLEYQRKHQKKLSKRRPGPPSEDLSGTLASAPQARRNARKGSLRKQALSIRSKSEVNSETTHSGFDPSQSQLEDISKMPDNVTVTTDQGYTYPKPPKTNPDGAKSYPCNWCFEEMWASELEKPGWWRSHFKKDLQPYVCISEDCIEPAVYFTSYALWRRHMEDVHTVDWAQRIHNREVWYCDYELNEFKEFDSSDKLREHLELDHEAVFSEVQIRRKILRNVLSSPRESNVCPLCSQNVLNIQNAQMSPDERGGGVRETLMPIRTKKKARFQMLDDEPHSSDDETTTPRPNSSVELEKDTAVLTSRQKLAKHVASHLKSLALLSIRYMDDDSASMKSEDAAIGVCVDGSDQGQLSDAFPLSDGALDFEDIPPDERSEEKDVGDTLDWNLFPYGTPEDNVPHYIATPYNLGRPSSQDARSNVAVQGAPSEFSKVENVSSTIRLRRFEDGDSVLVLCDSVGERLARQVERHRLMQSVSDICGPEAMGEIPVVYRELCERLSWEHACVVRPESREAVERGDARDLVSAVGELASKPFLCVSGGTCAADHEVCGGEGVRSLPFVSREKRVDVATLGGAVGLLGWKTVCTDQQWVLLREFWQDACFYNVLDYVVGKEEPSGDLVISKLHRRMQNLWNLWGRCSWVGL